MAAGYAARVAVSQRKRADMSAPCLASGSRRPSPTSARDEATDGSPERQPRQRSHFHNFCAIAFSQ